MASHQIDSRVRCATLRTLLVITCLIIQQVNSTEQETSPASNDISGEKGRLQSSADSFQTFLGRNGTTWHSTLYTSGMEDDLSQECLRECRVGTKKKRCHYFFKVEWYVSMSKACYSCPAASAGRDCLRPHCVALDGVERPLVTVNRRVPGPAIQVCEGDEIVVDVENELMSDSTSIHWHGLHQVGTPFMDGVPFLTQCPIDPGTTFRYHFVADLAGTHYWHSHSGLQRTDGMFGSLIVRSKSDPHSTLYDVDDPKHIMFLTDWLEKLGIDKFVNHHHTEHDNKPYNILVNGLGKFRPLGKKGNFSHTPLFEYRVTQGLRYRFRSLSNSIQNCPIEISVDNHTLLAIASDGHNIQPIEVESLVIYGGERWDFVVNANQTPGVYWVKFAGLLDCDDRFKSAHQVALLRYEGVSGGPPTPPEDTDYEATKRQGLQLNSLNAAPGDMVTFYTSADVRAYREDVDNVTSADKGDEEGTYGAAEQYSREPDHKFWLEFDFYSRNNDLFHNEDFYPFFGVEKKKRLYMPQINNISFKLPNVPPLSQPNELDESLLCNASSGGDCRDSFCYCTHVINLELGSLVEVILVDAGVVYWANHPFHIHGHAFAVLGMERLGEETTLEAVKTLDREGNLQRNFNDPPLKDTVTVPDGGYTVIRFIADNPGYWLFHCHISFHVETGMALAFHIGKQRHIPPVPKGFPRCGSWVPEPTEDLEHEVSKWMDQRVHLDLLNSPAKDNEYIPYETQNLEDNEKSNAFRMLPYLFLITLFLFFNFVFCLSLR